MSDLVQFRFREQGTALWLGNIDCLHNSEVYKALVEVGYNWEWRYATNPRRKLSLNYLPTAESFTDLLACLSAVYPAPSVPEK